MSRTKYITIEGGFSDHAIIFDEAIAHGEVALQFQKAHYTIRGAGFVNTQTGEPYGSSVSMKIGPRIGDFELLKRTLGIPDENSL